jgi:hypothetical protein
LPVFRFVPDGIIHRCSTFTHVSSGGWIMGLSADAVPLIFLTYLKYNNIN